ETASSTRRIAGFAVSETVSSMESASPPSVAAKRFTETDGYAWRARSSATRFCAAQVASRRSRVSNAPSVATLAARVVAARATARIAMAISTSISVKPRMLALGERHGARGVAFDRPREAAHLDRDAEGRAQTVGEEHEALAGLERLAVHVERRHVQRGIERRAVSAVGRPRVAGELPGMHRARVEPERHRPAAEPRGVARLLDRERELARALARKLPLVGEEVRGDHREHDPCDRHDDKYFDERKSANP